MESAAPPLVGFNNNVRYRGMRFHIQTEDSGVTRPHIITHLFADGGYVIKSIRTDYSEYVDRPDRPTVIQRLMREQHRAMALDLRDGRLDETIDRLIQSSMPPEGASPALTDTPESDAEAGPESSLPEPTVEAPTVEAPTVEAPTVEAPTVEAPAVVGTPPSAPQAAKPVAASSGKVVSAGAPATPSRQESKRTRSSRSPAEKPERARRSAPPPKRSQPAPRRAGRPSAALPIKPGAESIFGTAPQESLDDVILSYVTHAKNGPPSRGSK